MDDLSAMISQVLADPEKMKQVQAMAASLGLSGGGDSAPPTPPAQETAQPGPDLSALSGLLSGLAGGTGESRREPQPGAGFDAASLAGLLRAGNPPEQDAQGPGGFDIGMLARLQSAMANVQQNRGNIDLLLALRPRLGPARAKKIDDAIRIMQIIQFLPLLKESGLFGEMDSILSGLGGFGNVLGGLNGGLGGLIGNLTGRR